eukprot:TRINITY_DN52558_c0_g1_i1.p1 TRINITY_DN52558_c0_g1~~TRINITY_DN52558_c0_g1_i1.p1  ORF type:complete len:288 (-),score=34.07 TRINITY_DN52558_c0_g1_i1:219-1082(-)
MATEDDMPTSLAAVQAAGADTLTLDFPTEKEAADSSAAVVEPAPVTPISPTRRVIMSPSSHSSSRCKTVSLPLTLGSPPSREIVTVGSPTVRSLPVSSPVRPMSITSSPAAVRTSPLPSPTRLQCASPFTSAYARPFLHSLNHQGTVTSQLAAASSPGPRSPTVSLSALSPGGAIRHNAAILGIPLDLRGDSSSTSEFSVPIPVRTASGAIVAPSPVVARSSHVHYASAGHPLEPTRLNFGVPPPMPSLGSGYTAMVGGTQQVAPPSAIRAIVTPMRTLRTGVRGGA